MPKCKYTQAKQKQRQETKCKHLSGEKREIKIKGTNERKRERD